MVTADELEKIRERDAAFWSDAPEVDPAWQDRHALLAHLDAITEAVADEPVWHCYSDNGVDQGEHIDRAAVLAILRGEPRRHEQCCALPDDHAGECWCESGSDDD